MKIVEPVMASLVCVTAIKDKILDKCVDICEGSAVGARLNTKGFLCSIFENRIMIKI